MRPTYKKVKVLAPHCPKCEEKLQGDNSMNTPWKCSCGTWEAEPKYPFTGEYVAKPNHS